jgi:hypothetical protein
LGINPEKTQDEPFIFALLGSPLALDGLVVFVVLVVFAGLADDEVDVVLAGLEEDEEVLAGLEEDEEVFAGLEDDEEVLAGLDEEVDDVFVGFALLDDAVVLGAFELLVAAATKNLLVSI